MFDGYGVVLSPTILAHTKQSLINSEIEEIANKIAALDSIRAKLGQDLLKLQEDELELDDERGCICFHALTPGVDSNDVVQGVKERMEFEQSASKTSSAQALHIPPTTRRRKGILYLNCKGSRYSSKSRSSIPSIRARRTSSRCCIHGMSNLSRISD